MHGEFESLSRLLSGMTLNCLPGVVDISMGGAVPEAMSTWREDIRDSVL